MVYKKEKRKKRRKIINNPKGISKNKTGNDRTFSILDRQFPMEI